MVVMVVVLVVEEPLRSDTRLPLESSPYMAGNFLHRQSNDFLFPLTQFPSFSSCFFSALSCPSFLSFSSQLLQLQLELGSLRSSEGHAWYKFSMLQVSGSRQATKEGKGGPERGEERPAALKKKRKRKSRRDEFEEIFCYVSKMEVGPCAF